MTSITEYLKDGTLPGKRNEASKLLIKARQYELLEGVLYKRSFLKPWLRTAVCGSQSYVARILLANYAPGCMRDDTTRKGQVFNSRYGLFHKVDRSESRGDNHGKLVKHPQSNGLVERANQSLGEGIKARLGKGNKNWVEELPHVLWANRTMIKSSHGDTHFSLTYGTKAVIPAKIGMPTYRTAK
ncbi:reverse transcriptase domain-containing protein [Tanacetum coccineum]